MTDTDRYEFASQMAVLKSCPEAISRLLRKSSSVLLAAKVLVVSRLLHMKLSQRSKPPPYLENLRNRLGALRRRLLAVIDKQMKSLDTSSNALIEAMCAFSLATSSSPIDVLRHFHHARLEAMSEQLQNESNSREGILGAMQVYIRTLRDTRASFPTVIAQALENLKSRPLFQSHDLHALIELNLDLHGRWIGDDIRTFTPYIRLDDLQRSKSEEALEQWAGRGLSSLIKDLRQNLENLDDTPRVMDLRRRLFELWFCSQHQCKGIEPSEVVDGLRDAFNSRWKNLTQTQIQSLESVGSLIRTIAGSQSAGIARDNQSLWDSSILSMDTNNGAKAFRESLIARYQGNNEAFRIVSEKYTAWLQRAQSIEATIASAQAIRWEDNMADLDEVDDILNDKQALLSEDDPRSLQEHYSNAVQTAFGELELSINALTKILCETKDGQSAVFLLRCWRDLRQRMPSSYGGHTLGLASIAQLQKVLVISALDIPVQRGKHRIRKAIRTSKVPGRLLWDGDPPLPILPSPWAFRLLREVVTSMAALGSDVWSADAINRLKEELGSSMLKIVAGLDSGKPRSNGRAAELDENPGNGSKDQDILEQAEESDRLASSGIGAESPVESTRTPKSLTNGDVHESPIGGTVSRVKLQQAFDMFYLAYATRTTHSDRTEGGVETMVSKSTTDLDITPESNNRMKRSAEEYWKRTSLLFALLA